MERQIKKNDEITPLESTPSRPPNASGGHREGGGRGVGSPAMIENKGSKALDAPCRAMVHSKGAKCLREEASALESVQSPPTGY